MLCLAVTAAAALAGCAGDSGERTGVAVPASLASRTVEPSRPVAMIDGEPITWNELLPGLAEFGGGGVLQEAVLDRRLAKEMADAGLVLAADALTRERDLLVRSLQQGLAGVGGGGAGTPDEVSAAIARLRVDRGLGDTRFAQLLRRSAMLRALVQSRVVVTEEAVQQAFAIKYGEKRQCRIIVTPTQRAASEILARLATGNAGDLSARFAQAAREHSIDPSAFPRSGGVGSAAGIVPASDPSRAGLIELLSVQDPSYPATIRQAAGALGVGELSPVIALDLGESSPGRRGGFAILMLESIVPAAETSLPDSGPRRTELEGDVRLRLERLLMDQKAAELVGRPGVNILDRGLDWSWRNQGR